MTRRFALLFAVMVCLAVVPAGRARADLGGFSIGNFDVDLEVGSDAVLHVTERIVVDFSEPRRGIYRVIPVRYTDPKGYAWSLGFQFDGATDDGGVAHTAKVSRSGQDVTIRLGDADVFHTGRVVYVIRYHLTDAARQFPDHDELYWNVTGNEWNAAIGAATATVRLPAPLDADSLQATAYTGRTGSVETACRISWPEPGSVRYETTRPLEAFEGLTIAAAWPRGYVRFPGAAVRAGRRLRDNWILLAPVAAFAFLFFRYRRRGRDPEGPAAIMVRYEPPEGVTPGELGTIVDERVDLRDITATIVDLAVRGYLVIRMVEKKALLGLTSRDEPEFVRSEKPDADLLDHEKKVLRGLFPIGDTATLKGLRYSFYTRLPGIRDALYDGLTKKKYFVGSPASVRTRYTAGGFFLGIAVIVIGFFYGMTTGAIFPNFAIGPVLAGILTTALFAVFAPAMPRRTKSGVTLRAWAKGFEEFVDRVETERLEGDRKRQVFEALLPYAMALGVAERWADQFEGIYEAGASNPAWYVGSNPGRGFTTSSFEHGLTSAMASTGQSLVAAPRSTSSSGSSGFSGGSSGGGGGGGGGGSW